MSTEDNNNIPSSNTGPYCKARQKLPIETLESLVKLSGDSLSKSSNARWKIYNREVKLIDGTSLTMADSEENQSRYPQHDAQRKRRYLGRYFAHPMMQNRRAKRDDYKPSAVRVTQRYVP